VSGFLLDTNCISEIVRPRPDLGVSSWFESVDERLLHLSVLTLGEIRKGIAELTPGRKRASLENWLEIDLRERFAGRILGLDSEIADRWGWLAARAKDGGWTLPIIDGLIAATALHHNLTIVSRNAADFAKTQVPVLNPWKAANAESS
jgi:predicted nucleic acid-binding protein